MSHFKSTPHKKIKVILNTVTGGEFFRVKTVTNTLEWVPGQLLDYSQVDIITKRPDVEVVITK